MISKGFTKSLIILTAAHLYYKFKMKIIGRYSFLFWTLDSICNEQQCIAKGYCDVTLRLSWCTVIFPGFLTTAVTMWPCCSAWLTRCWPVCPVAPRTVIFILRLWSRRSDQTHNSDLWYFYSQEVPSLFTHFSIKKRLMQCNEKIVAKNSRLVI